MYNGEFFYDGDHRCRVMLLLTSNLVLNLSYYAFALLRRYVYDNGLKVYEHYVQYCALNGESCSNRADFWRAFKSHFDDKGVSMQIKRVNGIDHLCDYKYVAPSGSTDFEDIVINI